MRNSTALSPVLPAVARPPSQIDSQMRSLRDEIDNLEKSVASITDRLSPVLRSMQPGKAADSAAPEEILCPSADAIRTQATRVRFLAEALQEVTERIEA